MSTNGYRAQDTVAYNPDGTYSHGKPTTGDTQFGIDGRVPSPAFGMTKEAIGVYMLHARAAALEGEPIETVRAQGGRLFDSRYAQLKLEFEGRIESARRLIEPLESLANTIREEAKALPAVVKTERDKYTLPLDWRLLALLIVLLLWVCVAGSEWINAASRQVHQVQSWSTAMLATSPWLAVGVVLEWIILSGVGAASVFWRKVWRGLSIVSILLYACLYALRYGVPADASAVSALASALNGASTPQGGAFADQAVYFGQLFFGLVCGATLLEAALHLMVGRDVTVTNPDRQRLEHQAAAIVEQINNEGWPIWKARGHLAEYEACRTAFIDFGVRAYLAVAAERQLLDQEQQILQRERELVERKRRALLA